MNKAFVRDSDDLEIRCPLCGAAGQGVPEAALTRYVPAETRQRLGSSVYFCDTPVCEAVYFDAVEDYIRASELLLPAYPKDPDAPMCACFGLTSRDIDLDLAEGQPTRVRDVVGKAKSDAAHCSELSASGRSCIAEVQKYYIRRFQK